MTFSLNDKLTVVKVGVTFAAIQLRFVVLQFGQQLQRLCLPLLHPSICLLSGVVKISWLPSSCWGFFLVSPSWIIGPLFDWLPFLSAGT